MEGLHTTTLRTAVLPTLAALIVALLVLPASAGAAVITFGSDLSKPATVAEVHGPDAAFWNTRGAALGNVVPADGQVTELRLKGIAVPSSTPGAPGPLTQFHFQVLHPQPDGSVSVALSTNPMYLPAGGDPNRISTYRPDGYLCAKKGDYVDFNDEGGFVPGYYPGGVPYQVFSATPNAVTSWFSKDNGTNIGAVFTGQPKAGEELLLQAVLATGVDASPVCGGRKGKVFTGVHITKATVYVRRGSAPVRVTCPGVAQGRCQGTLTLTAKGAGAIGSSGLSVRPTTTVNLHVKLSKAGRKQLRKRRRLRVTAIANAKDLSGTSRRTSARILLRR